MRTDMELRPQTEVPRTKLCHWGTKRVLRIGPYTLQRDYGFNASHRTKSSPVEFNSPNWFATMVTIMPPSTIRQIGRDSNHAFGVTFVLFILLFSIVPSMLAGSVSAQDSNLQPEDIWSDEYIATEFPWNGDDAIQFKEYHDYDSI